MIAVIGMIGITAILIYGLIKMRREWENKR